MSMIKKILVPWALARSTPDIGPFTLFVGPRRDANRQLVWQTQTVLTYVSLNDFRFSEGRSILSSRSTILWRHFSKLAPVS